MLSTQLSAHIYTCKDYCTARTNNVKYITFYTMQSEAASSKLDKNLDGSTIGMETMGIISCGVVPGIVNFPLHSDQAEFKPAILLAPCADFEHTSQPMAPVARSQSGCKHLALFSALVCFWQSPWPGKTKGEYL